jgi:hypothetical protein
MLPLDLELSPDERDGILERAARKVVLHRMETPVILALELHRPLMFLGSQGLVVLTPMLAPLFGLRNLQVLQALLAEKDNLDRLLERIEELAHERDRQGGLEPAPTAEAQ